MLNLKFLNEAVKITNGNEFRLLYVIANLLSTKPKVQIYREMLAEKLDLGVKQVSRLTDSLVEKGLLKKDVVHIKVTKSVCFYSLNVDKNVQIVDKNVQIVDKNVQITPSKMDKNVQLTAENVDKNVPLNNKYINNNNECNEINDENEIDKSKLPF